MHGGLRQAPYMHPECRDTPASPHVHMCSGCQLSQVHCLRRRHGSENDDVAAFGPGQLYVVFVVADGGTDLERFGVRTAAEARSILLQARPSIRLP